MTNRPSPLYEFAHQVLPRDLGGGGVTWGLVTGTAAEGYLAMRYAEVAPGEAAPEALGLRPVLALGVADVRMVTLPQPTEATHGYFAAFVREAGGKLRYFVLEKADLGEPVLGEWRLDGTAQSHVNHGPVSESDVSSAQRAMMPEPHAAAFVVALTKVVSRSSADAPRPAPAAAAPSPMAVSRAPRPAADVPLAAHEIPNFRGPSANEGGGLTGVQQIRLVLIGVKLMFLLLYVASRGHC